MKAKAPLLLLLFFVQLSIYAQNNSIFFEVDTTNNAVDSIVFKSKKAETLATITKIPKKRKLKLVLYKDGVKKKVTIHTKYLLTYNTITAITPSKTDSLTINRDDVKISYTNKPKGNSHFTIELNTYSLIIENNILTIPSKEYLTYLNKYPIFFY